MWINLFLAVSVRSPVDDKLFYENMYIECISRQWTDEDERPTKE